MPDKIRCSSAFPFLQMIFHAYEVPIHLPVACRLVAGYLGQLPGVRDDTGSRHPNVGVDVENAPEIIMRHWCLLLDPAFVFL